MQALTAYLGFHHLLNSFTMKEKKSLLFLSLAVFVANSIVKNLHIGAMFYNFAV